MKKLIVLLLLLALGLPVQASETPPGSCQVVSAYYRGETLYTFLEGQPPDELGLLLNNTQVAQGAPALVSETEATCQYLFLMDLSTSMPDYQQWILSFTDALFAQETQPAEVAIAGFGDRFELLDEGMTTSDEVRRAIGNLHYDHTATDLSGCLAQALRYTAETPVEEGAVANVILFTDGIPWPEQADGWEEAAAITQDLAQAPEVMFHLASFGSQGDDVLLQALSSGKGLSLSITSRSDAEAGGTAVAQQVDSLYGLAFQPNMQLEEPRLDGQLFYQEDGSTVFLDLNHVRNYSVELPEEVSAPTEEPANSPEPEPTLEPEPPAVPEPESSAPPESSPPAEGTVTSEPQVESSQEPSTPSVSSGPVASEADDGEEEASFPPIWMIAAGGGAAVLIVLIVAVALSQRKKRSVPKEVEAPGIALKLEVFQGKPKKKQVVFTLANSLTIGSSASCDIVWNDPEMDGVCARIFLDEQGVFIESVSPRTQVFVEGILIHGPNRLRSGDRVTIAHSTFCLRF